MQQILRFENQKPEVRIFQSIIFPTIKHIEMANKFKIMFLVSLRGTRMAHSRAHASTKAP